MREEVQAGCIVFLLSSVIADRVSVTGLRFRRAVILNG